MVCVFGCGTCGSDSSSTSISTNTTLNQNLINILSTTANSVSTSTFTSQTITLLPCPENPESFRASCDNGLQVSQVTTADVKLITTCTDEQTQQLVATINAAIGQNSASNGEASAEFGTTTSNSTVTNSTVTNYLDNLVSSTITTSVVNNIISQFNFAQTQTIYMCGTWSGKSCSFSEDIQLSLIANDILSTVNTTVSNDAYLNSITQTNSSTSTTTSTGLTSLAGTVLNGFGSILDSVFGGVLLYEIIFFGFIALLLLGGLYLALRYTFGEFGSSSSSSTSSQPASNLTPMLMPPQEYPPPPPPPPPMMMEGNTGEPIRY